MRYGLLADDESVEEQAQRRQVLLDAQGGERAGELPDVSRDHHGLELFDAVAAALAPSGEAPGGSQIRKARVAVWDLSGEKLPEGPFGVGGGGEERRPGAADEARRAGVGRRALEGVPDRWSWERDCRTGERSIEDVMLRLIEQTRKSAGAAWPSLRKACGSRRRVPGGSVTLARYGARRSGEP